MPKSIRLRSGVLGRVLSAPFRFANWAYWSTQPSLHGEIRETLGTLRASAPNGVLRTCCTTRTGEPHMTWCPLRIVTGRWDPGYGADKRDDVL
jgi:hypothetical protein